MNIGSNPASAHPQAPPLGAEASQAFALAFAQVLAPLVAHLAARLRWFRWLAPICPALARAIDQLERLLATLATGDLPGPRHTQVDRPASQPTPAVTPEDHPPSQRAHPPAPTPQRARPVTFASSVPALARTLVLPPAPIPTRIRAPSPATTHPTPPHDPQPQATQPPATPQHLRRTPQLE